PRRLSPRLRVPGVAHEDSDPGLGDIGDACLPQEIRHARVARRRIPVHRQVIESGQRVGLAAAELSDERQNRRGVLRLSGESSQNHTGVFAERPREAGAGEELTRISVILRRGPGHDLLEGDGELVRVERAALPDLLAWRRYLVPGLHADPPTVSAYVRTAGLLAVSAARGLRRPRAQSRSGRRTSDTGRRW